MADLIDRISGVSEPGRPTINIHRFIGVERLYALGEWTRAEIATEFDLQGDEATQATQLANNIDAAATVAEKQIYVLRVEAVTLCLQDHMDRLYHNVDGVVNKAKVYEDLQVTG